MQGLNQHWQKIIKCLSNGRFICNNICIYKQGIWMCFIFGFQCYNWFYSITSFLEIFWISLKTILIVWFFRFFYFRCYNVLNSFVDVLRGYLNCRVCFLEIICKKSVMVSHKWLNAFGDQGFFLGDSSVFESLWIGACSSNKILICLKNRRSTEVAADRLTWDRILSQVMLFKSFLNSLLLKNW